jgi:hypothetical protein
MGRLRFGWLAWLVVTTSLFSLLPACGGHKPAGTSPFPVTISLSPGTSYSLQTGNTVQFFANAENSSNARISATFTFAISAAPGSSSPSGVLDITSNGVACAGTWNAPLYTICSPGNTGVVEVTATALGATSPPVLVFVHPPIDNIQISVVPPVNSPPPACPNQLALPEACNIPFNTNAGNYCMSQNQIQTLQATAYSQGLDISASVGPFTWTPATTGVVTITPIVTVSSLNVATNQATASPNAPGQTQVIATASGVFSQPYTIETCPVQCIALQIGAQNPPVTNFVVDKGTSETITATAVDVQGCIVPKPPLTWVSSSPAALIAGSATSGCGAGTTCTVSTPQPGSAAITASCTPPTCNVGFPLNPLNYQPPLSLYVPEPVYPVTAISGLVAGAATSATVLATSQDCSSNILCTVGIYNVSGATNLEGFAFQLPSQPNSLLFDGAGDKAYMGSDFGAVVITPANFATANPPFASLAASGTIRGSVTGKILAISATGTSAIFSDTVSTPNQVYVVSPGASATTLNINGATAAAFSPDGLKVFILGDGGNTLYVYSQLQSLQPAIPLGSPASAMVFNSSGTFALLSGGIPAGSPAGSLAVYNTCDNSAVTLQLPVVTPPPPPLPGPPLFLKMVPAAEIPQGNPSGNTFGGILIPNVEPTGLDFFFGLDNTGIDIIATNSSAPLSNTLCPQQVSFAYTAPPQTAQNTFSPVHINLGRGTFHPINFFLSPDATRAYIVTLDFGVLIYDFNTDSVSSIPLINNATPVAADMTVDGTQLFVAGSDGLLHQLNTNLALDLYQTTFTSLPNSANPFCYTGTDCNLNLVAVKP